MLPRVLLTTHYSLQTSMKQFQVPQFITIEDKVFGPFTIKQFLYLAGGGVLIVILRMQLILLFFIPLALLICGLAASFAFLKINEQPFPTVFRNFLFYLAKPRLYVWKKEAMPARPSAPELKNSQPTIKSIPRVSESKLTDLAWSLDIKEKVKR